MFSDLGLSDQKMYFLFEMSLTIVNEGSSLTVVSKGSFSNTIVFKKRLTIVFENDSLFKTKNDRF